MSKKRNKKSDALPCQWIGSLVDKDPMNQAFRVEISPSNPVAEIMVASDLHTDSKYHQDWWFKYLADYAVSRGMGIILGGDTFDVMNGKSDPRRDPISYLIPELSEIMLAGIPYYDAVPNLVFKRLKRYAHHILSVQRGNHDDHKHSETDLVRRLVSLFNSHKIRSASAEKVTKANKELFTKRRKARQGRNYGEKVLDAPYKSFARFEVDVVADGKSAATNPNARMLTRTFAACFFHGMGGGGFVSKGNQHFAKLNQQHPGMDMLFQGHYHWAGHQQVATVAPVMTGKGGIVRKIQHQVLMPSFKIPDYGGSWDATKLIDVKPIGATFLRFEYIDATGPERVRDVQLTVTQVTR